MSTAEKLFAWTDNNANIKTFYTIGQSVALGTRLYDSNGNDTGKTVDYLQNNTFNIKCQLTVNTVPSDATVQFNTGTVSGKTCFVPNDTSVTYTVSKTGYVSQTFTTKVSQTTQTDNRQIDLANHTITIKTSPEDATVTFDTDVGTVSGKSCTAPYGTTVTYTISKPGYLDSQSYKTTIVKTETIIAPALTMDTVTLTVTPIPSNSTVKLTSANSTGTQSGNKITVQRGSTVNYTISNTGEGYTTRTGSINLSQDTAESIRLAKPLTLINRFTGGVKDILTQALSYDKYNYVKINYAGAAGQKAYGRSSDNSILSQGTPGRGAVKSISASFKSDVTIQMIIGLQPEGSLDTCGIGGFGYDYGDSAYYVENPDGFKSKLCAGAGGGSTAISLDKIYEACGGGGVGLNLQLYNMYNITSGAGGGATGGGNSSHDKTSEIVNGLDATDANIIGYNSGNGYVEIYAESKI